MKIVGIFLILVCLVLNAFIGFILYINAYQAETTKSINLSEKQEEITLKEHTYTSHGFSFSLSDKFISDKTDMKKDMIDYLYTNDTSDSYSPSIQVYYYADKPDINVDDSQKYVDYYGKPSFGNEYVDGGIVYIKNGKKMYYDVLKQNDEDIVKKIKIYSFYHNNSGYQIVFKDDSLSFDKNVVDFDDNIIGKLILF